MIRSAIALLFFVACNSKPKDMDGVAETVIHRIERTGTDKIGEYLVKSLLESRKEKLDSVIGVFRREFLKLADDSQRFEDREFDDDTWIYRYRYSGEGGVGVVLQLELLFEDDDKNFRIKDLTLIPADSFAKERLYKRVPYKIHVQ